jgi:hypothetical protein
VIASAAKIGESAPSKTELQPPGTVTVWLGIDNHASAANRDDNSVMNIVKNVNRLSLDPSKGASCTDLTLTANAGKQVSGQKISIRLLSPSSEAQQRALTPRQPNATSISRL